MQQRERGRNRDDQVFPATLLQVVHDGEHTMGQNTLERGQSALRTHYREDNHIVPGQYLMRINRDPVPMETS